MKRLLTSPFNAISSSMHSHRAAQGVIYADMIYRGGNAVDIDFGNKANYDDYDTLLIYHGNDWSGSLNLFGGMKAFAGIDRIIELSNYKGQVVSLIEDMPDYHGILYERYKKLDDLNSQWHKVNWEGMASLESRSITLSLQDLNSYSEQYAIGTLPRTLVIGDSHAISLYCPGTEMNSVPFKTLHGALNEGLETFLLNPRGLKEVDSYFGNIDIRHHLMRQENPSIAAKQLAQRYVYEATLLADKYELSNWNIFVPLPIEDESRQVPKTGWYKGTPFFGSWKERNQIRTEFNGWLRVFARLVTKAKITIVDDWADGLMNSGGQLDFKHMEKPRSIHLSRASYPFWTGQYWNDGNGSLAKKAEGIEGFFGE
jgi:hypothetical protein